MKFRPTLLLCAVVLAVALPIWADGVPYTGAADEFRNMEIAAAVTRRPGTTLKAPVKTGFPPKAASAVAAGWADAISYIGSAEESPNIAPSAKVTATSRQVLIAPANAEFPAEPASAVVLTDSFETNNALDAGDLNSSSIRGTFFPSSSDTDIRTASLSDHDSFERGSPISHAEKSWYVETTGYGEGRTDEHERRRRKLVPVLVPEPGSLSLLLLGLAAVGFLARRRGNLPTAA
jgi:hypothetical protein